MSRRTLKPMKPEHEGYEIVVGRDGTLGNFFGEVRRPHENESDLGGEVVVSAARVIGAPPFGIDFNKVINTISDYAVIDDNLRTTLWADREREGTNFRS